MEGGLKPPRSPKNPLLGLPGRRSNGQGQIRKPGVEWNNVDEIDDGRDEALDVSDDERDGAKANEIEKSPSGGRIVDLLDMARPAKPKGIKSFAISNCAILHDLTTMHYTGLAKEFEVVQGSPRVIALPDEPRVPAIKDEDWESIDSEVTEQRRSYSAVVRDNEDF